MRLDTYAVYTTPASGLNVEGRTLDAFDAIVLERERILAWADCDLNGTPMPFDYANAAWLGAIRAQKVDGFHL